MPPANQPQGRGARMGTRTPQLLCHNRAQRSMLYHRIGQLGDRLSVASRMRVSAGDGQILIGRAAAAEVCDAFALEPLGKRPLRGFADAVPVFSVEAGEPGLATRREAVRGA